MGKGVKAVLVTISGVLLLIIALCLFISTGYLNNFMAGQALHQTQKYLNGKLSFGEVSGNPLSHLSLHQISLSQAGKQVARIGRTEIEFSLIRLLSNELAIKKITLQDVQIEIKQLSDTLWNIEQLYNPGTAQDKNPSDTSNFLININEIECQNFNAILLPLDSASLLPRHIQTNFRLGLMLQAQNMKLELKAMNLYFHSPDLAIQNLTFSLNSDSTTFNWKDLLLESNGTKIRSNGTFVPKNPFLSTVSLAIDTLALETLHKYIPAANLKGHPSVDISLKGGKERIYLSSEIREADQTLRLAGWIKEVKAKPTYDLHLNVQNLDGSHWTGDAKYSTRISGTIQIFGRGFDLRQDSIQASAIITEIQYRNKTIRQLTFTTTKEADQLNGIFDAKTWFGRMKTDFHIEDLFADFRYLVHTTASQIDLSKLDLPYQLSTSLNIQATAKGIGMNPLAGTAEITARSFQSTICNRPIEEIKTSFFLQKGSYNLKELTMITPYFQLSTNAKGKLKQQNKVQYSLETKDFNDLMRIMQLPPYAVEGKIQGTFAGNSRIYDATVLFDHLNCFYDTLSLTGLKGRIDISKEKEFAVAANLEADQLSKDSLAFNRLKSDLNLKLGDQLSMLLKFSSDSVRHAKKYIGAAKGWANLQSDDSIRMESRLQLDSLFYAPYKTGKIDLSMKMGLPTTIGKENPITSLWQLTNYFKVRPLQNYLTLLKKQSADVSGQLELNSLSTDSLTVEKSTVTVKASVSAEKQEGKLLATIDNVNFYGVTLREGKLATQFTNNDFQNQLNFTFSDTVSGQLNASIHTGPELTVGLKHFFLKSPKHTWDFGSDSTIVSYSKEKIAIRNLAVSADKVKYLTADGFYSFKGPENLNIHLERIDLQNLNKVVRGPIPLSGIGATTLQLTGTSDKPVINASIQLNELKVKEDPIGDMRTNLSFSNDSLRLTTQLEVNKKRLLEGELSGNYHLSLEDKFILPPLDLPVRTHLRINQLDLSLFKPFLPFVNPELGGILESDLKASGPMNNLNFNGVLTLTDGKLHLPDYGIAYDRMHTNLKFSHDSILIQDFVAEAGSGSMNINGYTSIELSNYYEPKYLSLNIIGKEFKILDSERLQATVNSNISLHKENENSKFSGKVDVIRSNANADILLASYNRIKEFSEKPLLIKAMEENGVSMTSEKATDSIPKNLDPAQLLYRNLQGSINIHVPGNMWIRGKDMGLEVKGDLQATKEGEKFVLFGQLEVKRGFYKLYGKRFEFKSGIITLTGEDEINPVLDFVVAYPFHDLENKSRSLNLKVTGRLKEPILTFEIDGKTIDEQDAISYLVFGSSANELSQKQQSAMNFNASGMATNLAMSQMSAMLKDVIQSSLKMDVVEISGDNNWSMGSVKVGKYIGKNLFISYQYNFALDKKTKVIEPMVISIEYQFFNFLSLSATNQSSNTGFDLIFKKEF